MSTDWTSGEVLKAIFPLLDGEELATCMLVCRQWRDIARDDYLWKCICSRRWPSTCKKKSPPISSYRKLFVTFSRRQYPTALLPPRISFRDLEFYIDVWSDEKLVFSEATSGSTLRAGIKNPPAGISDVLRDHLNSSEQMLKMMLPVNPGFKIPSEPTLTVSVLVGRRDTNKMACLLKEACFNYIDTNDFRALAYDYLTFSPLYPFVLETRAWVSLLFTTNGNDSSFDVFGIEMDFCDAACSEDEILWLLDMLDWK